MPDPAAVRRPFVAGNWKMHKTQSEAVSCIGELLALLPELGEPGTGGLEVAVCPSFTALEASVGAAAGTGILVAAQNMHQAPEGGHTGEVSAAMLMDVGVGAVVLGHSERRRDNGETDRALQEKLPAAIAAGLRPILCVGESESERDSGDTQRRLRHQVQEALERVPIESLGEIVIAYEPVWAIGSGRSASAEQAQEAIAFVRALVGDRSPDAADRVRVLYGGSVKRENAAELMAQPDVDGALVGGASLDAPGFAAIVEAARAPAAP